MTGTPSNHTRYVVCLALPGDLTNSIILVVLIVIANLKVVIVKSASWGCLWGNK